MGTEYKGADRITLAKVQVGDYVRTRLTSKLEGVQVIPDRDPHATVRRVAEVERIVRPVEGGQPAVEYVLTFHDGTVSEPRYGTTSWYRVPAPDVVDVTSTAPVSLIKGEGPAKLGQLQGLASDPDRRAQDSTADESEPYDPGDIGPVGDRCGTCRGHGVVRCSGKPYRRAENAHQAREDGRAFTCTTCEGEGDLPPLIEAAEASGRFEIVRVGA